MADTTSGHVRRGEAEWRAIRSAFAGSGLSQKRFCERERLALSTFQYWKRRVAQDDAAPSDSGPAVIDLGALDGIPPRMKTAMVA